MRHAILTLAFCMASLAVSAQAPAAHRLHFSAEAGLTISNYTSTSRYWRQGFYVGGRATYDFGPCYGAASLRLVRKGADAFNGDSDSDDHYEAYYLELPVTFGMSARLSSKVRLFVETGPYLAVGVGGKYKGSAISSDGEHGLQTVTWDRPFFSTENDSPRRFDAGWNVSGGVLFGHVSVMAGYEIGFAPVWDVENSLLSTYDCHNSTFTLGVAYNF